MIFFLDLNVKIKVNKYIYMSLLIFPTTSNSSRRTAYHHIVLRDTGSRYLASNPTTVHVLPALIIYWTSMGKELIWSVESMKFGNVLGHMFIHVYKLVQSQKYQQVNQFHPIAIFVSCFLFIKHFIYTVVHCLISVYKHCCRKSFLFFSAMFVDTEDLI